MSQGFASKEISTEEIPSLPAAAAHAQASSTLQARARHLLQRSGAALHEWATPATNPFLQRAIRIESRKHKPFLTLLGVALFAFALNGAGWRLWLLFVDNSRWISRRFATFDNPGHLPAALGSTPVGFIALLTAAACTYGVLWAARARSAYLLRQELLKSTLDGLHQMPIAEERWLWMMSAHPTALSLLIGFIGLPVYAMACWVGQWSLLDIVGLFLLFLMLGHAAPVWKPMLWQQLSARKNGRGFNWKQWQEMLKQAQLEAKALGSDTAIDPLERQRRIQRVLSGAAGETTNSNAANSTISKPVTSEAQHKSAANTPAVFWGNANNSGWGGFVVMWLMLQGFMVSLGPLMGAGGGPWGTWRQYLNAMLPSSVLELVPGFIVTWPLMTARLLFSPMPFFGFSLPPFLFVLPFWVGLTHQTFTSLAANVSPVETFWTQPRLQCRKEIGAALWLAALFFVFGYGWPILIRGGELSRLLPGVPLTRDWALAVAWTIAIVLGTLLAGIAIEAPFKRAGNGGISQAAAWQSAALSVGFGLGGAIVLYFGFCWLGGVSGISPAWTQRVLPTLAVAAAFLLADFGSAALGAVLPLSARSAWGPLRLLWFHGLGLTALGLLMYTRSSNAAFPFTTAAPVFLSPFATLFSLFRSSLGAPVGIWHGVLLQAIFGSAFLLIAARMAFAENLSQHAVEADVASGWMIRLLTLLLTPLRLVKRVLLALLAAILSASKRLGRVLGSWDDAILNRVKRYDNPVLVAEMRRRLQREHWPVQWIIAGLVVLGLLGLVAFFTWDTRNFSQQLSWEEWAETGTVSCLLAAWALVCFAVSGLGQSFDRERLNGTTVFLFLTPMTDPEILKGKLVPSLIYTFGFLLCVTPVLAICGTIALFCGLKETFIAGICGLMAIAAVLLFAACLQLLFGVRAVKPTEGTAKALLCLLPVEAITGFSLIFCYNFGHWLGIAMLILLTLLHLGLAFGCWRLAVKSLRRQRYGDVAASGKMAN